MTEREKNLAACLSELLPYAVEHLQSHKHDLGETRRNARYHAAVQADIDQARRLILETTATEQRRD